MRGDRQPPQISRGGLSRTLQRRPGGGKVRGSNVECYVVGELHHTTATPKDRATLSQVQIKEEWTEDRALRHPLKRQIPRGQLSPHNKLKLSTRHQLIDKPAQFRGESLRNHPRGQNKKHHIVKGPLDIQKKAGYLPLDKSLVDLRRQDTQIVQAQDTPAETKLK